MLSLTRKSERNKLLVYSDFELEVLDRLDCLQRSQARSRQDIRQIVREEIARAISDHNRKGWSQIV